MKISISPLIPKLIISAPYAKKEGQNLKSYVLSLIEYFRAREDRRTCAELYHFLIQAYDVANTDKEPKDLDKVGIDIHFENKTIAEFDDKESRGVFFIDFASEFYGYLKQSVELFLSEKDFARTYEILCFYNFNSIFEDNLERLEELTNTIEKYSTKESDAGFHAEKLADCWQAIFYPARLNDELAHDDDEEKILKILSIISNFYHQALVFYEKEKNTLRMAEIYLKLSTFAQKYSDQELYKQENRDALAAKASKKKQDEYINSGINICLGNQHYDVLNDFIDKFGKEFSETQWSLIKEKIFNLADIKQEFVDDWLWFFSQFLKNEELSTNFLPKLPFILAKIAAANLDWSKVKQHSLIVHLMSVIAQRNFPKNLRAQELLMSIAALFTWGKKERILSGQAAVLKNYSLLKLMTKSPTKVTPLYQLETQGTVDFLSLFRYTTVIKDLIEYNRIILESSSKSSNAEIKLFIAVTQLVSQIYKLLPSFEGQIGPATVSYVILEESNKKILDNQFLELNQLLTVANSLGGQCLNNLNLGLELGAAQRTIISLKQKLIDQQNQINELQGNPLEVGTIGALGETVYSDGKKRKQTELPFFINPSKKSKTNEVVDAAKLKIEEDVPGEKTQEESAKKF